MAGIIASTTFQCGYEEQPVFRQLLLSADTISRSASGTITPASIEVERVEVIGEEVNSVTYGSIFMSYEGEAGGVTLTGKTVKLSGIKDSYTALTLVWISPDGETVFFTTRIPIVRDGATGAAGKPVFTPPPMQWSDYPEGFIFQSGATGESYRHCVIHGFAANGKALTYECIKSHGKMTGGNEPGTAGGNHYWKAAEGGPFNLLSTEVLLAAQAFIKCLSSNGIQLYSPDGKTLCGEIRGYGSDGTMMSWIGGTRANPLWGVSGNGTQYVGGITGQRIVLDPHAKCMYVYDSNNQLVSTHSGRVLSLGMAKPGGTSSIPSNTADITFGRTTQQGYRKSTVTISETGGVTGSGLLQISVPQLTITAQSNNEEQTPSSGGAWEKDVPTTTAGLMLRVTVNGTVRLSRLLANVAVGYNDTGGGIDLTNRIVTTSAVTENVSLETGDKYQIELELSTSISGGQGSGGYVSATTNGKMTAAFVAKAYRCEYAANGWVISYDAQNYEYCLVIDGKLHRMCVCNGVKLFGND
ncbi:MAG: hypothetical protein HDS35_00035 [Bacteroides sp.]|nr:hypothetical protein [Bacteroides sp.]